MSDFINWFNFFKKIQNKKKCFALVFCFALSFQIFSINKGYSQWYWQNPTPQGNMLNDISFLDANNAIAVAEGGSTMRTTNGGDNWMISNFFTGNADFSLNRIKYIAPNTAIATGFNNLTPTDGTGGIFKTTDGGNSWVHVYVAATSMLFGISFTDNNTGTVVGMSQSGSDIFSVILKTTDGGNTWIPQANSFTVELSSIYFSDLNNGTIVGGQGKIFRTINGGMNWAEQTSPTIQSLRDVYFVNADIGTAVGDEGTILHTTNGGQNWTIQIPVVMFPFLKVHFINSSTGIIAGQGGILRTTDGGNNWGQSIPTGLYLSVSFGDASAGIAVGSSGIMARSADGGENWVMINNGATTEIRNIFFSTESIATAVGSSGVIWRTTNAGQNWFSQSSGTTSSLNSVYFTGINYGTAVGAGGTIVRSTDGGNNWVSQSSGGVQALNDVFFTDVNTGYAVGASGKIIKTTNGGSNWFTQTSGGSFTLNEVFFTDANTGIIAALSGRILRTTNGGDNWVIQINGSQALNALNFVDAIIGYAVGAQGRILKTTNGGLNWTAQTSGTTRTFQSVSFSDLNTGIIVGAAGTVFKTTNGGTNWIQQVSGTANALADVFYTGLNIGTIVGSNGTILREQSAPINPGFGSNNQTGDNLYYFANSVSSGAPSQPDFIWRDTTGSISLYADGSNQASGIFTGDNDNGRWNILGQLAGGSIRFFGSDYTNIHIGTNGIIGFNEFSVSAVQPPSYGLAQSLITEAIFALWMNMNIDYAGVSGRRISYKVTASEVVITYNRIPVYAPWSLTNDPDRYISFQVIIKFNNCSPSQNSQIFISYNNDETGSLFVNEYNAAILRPHLVGVQKNNDAQQFFQYRFGNSLTLRTEGPLFGSNLTLAMGANQNVLPVELASFTASVNNRDVNLHWATVNEINNSGFDIERAIDGQWSKIAFIKGNGTTSENKNYSFVDKSLNAGKYNYRLKQIDFNGNYEYINLSNEIIIGVPSKFDLSQNYPNPFNPVTKINFDIPVESKVSIKIFDITGREVANLVNEIRPAGYYTIAFDAVNFASGIYFYNITASSGTSAQFTMTKKMMILK